MTARRPFKLVAPIADEHALQKQVADVLRIEIGLQGHLSRAGVVWFSVDHPNFGGITSGTHVARGIPAGIPDMHILYRGRAHYVELKTHAAHSALSDAQKSMIAAILAAGGRVGVAATIEQYLACLDTWDIPRARRVKLGASC